MPDAIMPTYGRQDISFVEGDGAWLTDTNGNRFLDALALLPRQFLSKFLPMCFPLHFLPGDDDNDPPFAAPT